jgi:hypothetical protein
MGSCVCWIAYANILKKRYTYASIEQIIIALPPYSVYLIQQGIKTVTINF